MNNGNCVARTDVVRIATEVFPGRNLVIHTNQAYPLLSAACIGEVWIVDADKDQLLFSSVRANWHALEELKKLRDGIPMGLLPNEEVFKGKPFPEKWKARIRSELSQRIQRGLTVTDCPERRDAIEAWRRFHLWLGLEDPTKGQE